MAAADGMPLQLEVFINDQPTGLIGAFTLAPDGRISTTAQELRAIGIRPPPQAANKATVVLDQLKGVHYEYHEAQQTLSLYTPDGLRLARKYDARGERAHYAAPQSDWGAAVNYSAFGTTTRTSDAWFAGETASLSLENWIFSPYGRLASSELLSTSDFHSAQIKRLDTNWSYSDPKTLRTYVVGDAITGGLAWTRPIRFGGVQIRRNFDLRPDLITVPLPTIRGSAAVPSSVDVYINNVKVHTQDVAAGPFEIQNIPNIGDSGQAQVVVRGITGREQVQTAEFYSSPMLLRKGLFDYSLESGLARRDYSTGIDSYDRHAMAAASLRYGLSDRLTLEGHVETSSKLVNGGAGLVYALTPQTVVSAAVSGSLSHGLRGAQLYAAIETHLKGINISASTQRTLGDYVDLAAITGKTTPVDAIALISGLAPPKAVDRLSLGVPIPWLSAGLSLNFLNIEVPDAEPSRILAASYNQQLGDWGSLFVTGFADFNHFVRPSVFAGLSVPLDGRRQMTASVANDDSGTTGTVNYTKAMAAGPHQYGWSVYDSEGARQQRGATFDYRGNKVLTEVTATQIGSNVAVTGFADGAVTLTRQGIFASKRINDSFAVVNVGAPGVEVYAANRLVGTTAADGKLLVPDLISYERNRVSIDPRHLPVDASVPVTNKIIVPADRSGVNVDFGVKSEVASAVVVLVDAQGHAVRVGSQGKLQANGENFVVGYDGRAFIENLASHNTATVQTGKGVCTANFDFRAKANAQVVIGPVTCQG